MNNFGLKQIGILKCQAGTPRGGLVNHLNSGSWGDRGQGNELLSAFENGLSWIGDKIANMDDYIEDGFNYLVTAPMAAITGKTKEIPIVIDLMRLQRHDTLLHYANIPLTDFISPVKGGWMLKGLMKGSPLERLLSKMGTININSLLAYLNKASKLELDVVGRLLNSRFHGLKNINYNELKKAVLEELISYSRKPLTEYATYGMKRLGFDEKQIPDGAGDIITYSPGVKTQTFTFESPRIPGGDARHYDPTTLGHSRTYTTPDEPDILHVMESQSDWALNKVAPDLKEYFPEELKGINWAIKRILEPYREKFITAYPQFTKHYDDYIQASRLGLNPLLDNDFADAMEQILPYDHFENVINRYARIKSGKNLDLYNYLQHNYLPRQLLENMIFAAEQGLKKMRYPTSETAAKIEGYKKENRSQLLNLRRLIEKALKDFESGVIEYLEYEKLSNDLLRLMREALNSGLYSPEHQTILKKYADFPKMFNKLFKGKEVRTITDPKGNTWYEVDIPEDFLNLEWLFKKGGKIGINNVIGV